MKSVIILAIAGLILVNCGGRSSAPSPTSIPNPERITMFSDGPIKTACLNADRDAANRKLCGCVQTVANLTLGVTDQERAVTFFGDPHEAQVVRTSSNRSDKRFWDRYKAFSGRAKRSCDGY
ncbi:MAG: hypothetical protein P8Q92_15650 [Pseudoprimorskyibacter sp.]|nr:hypothetical protein [Pseudoprimorskyibacter sp.]